MALIIAVVVLASNGQEPGRFTVTGAVRLQDGSAAQGATVGVVSLSGYRYRISESRTDQKGNFILQLPAGQWAVTAYDLQRGFPDAANAIYGPNGLYGKKGYMSVSLVNVGEGLKPPDLQLQFDGPDALIEWTLRSRRTGAQIKDFNYSIRWADDPNVYGKWSGSRQELLLVVPRHRTVITIGAQGYKDWSSTEINGAENGFSLPLGKRDQRTIYLEDR